MSEAIAKAGNVLIVGFRTGYPVAMRLRESLAQVRPRVLLAPQPGQSLGEELVHAGAGDVVIVIGFRRRVSGFGDIMRFLPRTGAKTVLIADSTARRYARSTAGTRAQVTSIPPTKVAESKLTRNPDSQDNRWNGILETACRLGRLETSPPTDVWDGTV
ncbi:MurR/RpiR family transcriptional regulator [Arthrobacter sp. NPDC056493]|uniref:MurR/RpiR family transcriptional regulator n=1 Tax=Arthrobacter sp. NPDC056493 TaxID=3345839 RepID=UPI00367317C5